MLQILDWDFSTIERTKDPSTNYRAEHYHKEIVTILENKSAEKIGLDREKWRGWLERRL